MWFATSRVMTDSAHGEGYVEGSGDDILLFQMKKMKRNIPPSGFGLNSASDTVFERNQRTLVLVRG